MAARNVSVTNSWKGHIKPTIIRRARNCSKKVMLYRSREACGVETVKLEGVVEPDETCIGGKEKNKHLNKKIKPGCGAVGKTAGFGTYERGDRVKAMPVD